MKSNKEVFISGVKNLARICKTTNELSELLGIEVGEGFIGEMEDAIGELLLRIANPSLDDIGHDYFGECLWRYIFEDDDDDIEELFNDIVSNKVPQVYIETFYS